MFERVLAKFERVPAKFDMDPGDSEGSPANREYYAVDCQHDLVQSRASSVRVRTRAEFRDPEGATSGEEPVRWREALNARSGHPSLGGCAIPNRKYKGAKGFLY